MHKPLINTQTNDKASHSGLECSFIHKTQFLLFELDWLHWVLLGFIDNFKYRLISYSCTKQTPDSMNSWQEDNILSSRKRGFMRNCIPCIQSIASFLCISNGTIEMCHRRQEYAAWWIHCSTSDNGCKTFCGIQWVNMTPWSHCFLPLYTEKELQIR